MPQLNLDFGDGVLQPSTPEGTPSSAPVDITGTTTKPGEVDITNQDGKTTPTEPTTPATPTEPATPSEPTTPPTTPAQPTDTNPSTGGQYETIGVTDTKADGWATSTILDNVLFLFYLTFDINFDPFSISIFPF